MRKTFLNSTQYLEQQPYSLKAKKDLNTYNYMIKKRFLGRMKNKESNVYDWLYRFSDCYLLFWLLSLLLSLLLLLLLVLVILLSIPSKVAK